MPPRGQAPEAAIALCPSCGEEQLHDVLQASGGAGRHATVQCRECRQVHRAVLASARQREVPLIISKGGASERARVALPDDEQLAVGDELVAAEQQVKVTALDRRDGRRVRRARADELATIWAVNFEEFTVKFSVNMGRKTISKAVQVSPHDRFSVGDELDLDRLRIYIHAIKTREGTLHRGSAEARDVVRVFARPVRLTEEEARERRAALGLPEPKRRIRERRRAGKLPLAEGPPPRTSRGRRRGPSGAGR
jgi:uncharacterized Zn finger protein